VPSVLIVDDDAPIQELLRRWLKPAGYVLRFAENANAALDTLAEQKPAVIVCDIHMPGANGLWLADQVRGIAPTTAIVLATGDQNIPPFETLRHAVVAYVLKPLQREQLLDAVAAGVAWSRAAAARAGRTGRDPRRLPAARE
jgi:CheY-like chemotaxis protein